MPSSVKQARKSRDENSHGENFVLIYAVDAANLFADEDLSHSAKVIAGWLIAKMEFGGAVKVSQRDIAAALKKDPADVSRALRQLEQKFYIGRKRIGRNVCIRVSPYVAYRGRAEDAEKARNRWAVFMAEVSNDRIRARGRKGDAELRLVS